MIDVSQFTTEMIDLGGEGPADDVFEAIGFRVAQVQGASPSRRSGSASRG